MKEQTSFGDLWSELGKKRKAFVVMEINCGTHYLNAIDAYNLSLCNCRGSYVEVEGQKSRVENNKFLSILKVLQPF